MKIQCVYCPRVSDYLEEALRHDFECHDYDSEVYVQCDDKCGAKNNPLTSEELHKAYHHWKYHGRTQGCAHGR